MNENRSLNDLEAGMSAEAIAESDRVYLNDLQDILTMKLREIGEPLKAPDGMTDDEYEHLDAFDAFKRTVQALGGELEVTVRLPGRTFVVTVPAPSPVETQAEASPTAAVAPAAAARAA